MQAHARRWIYVAAVYFSLALMLGLFMSVSADHSLRSVHAHLHLVGWLSMAMIGVVYHFFPRAGASLLAAVQFWMYQTGLPLMMVALAFYLKGYQGVVPLLGLGSVLVLLSGCLFAGNLLWRRA